VYPWNSKGKRLVITMYPTLLRRNGCLSAEYQVLTGWDRRLIRGELCENTAGAEAINLDYITVYICGRLRTIAGMSATE
jgi:hypothetical protein